MSMKNYNDTIRNRTRDLPACSAVASTNYASSVAALHTVSFVQYGCFAGKCILTGSTEDILQGRWQHGEKVGYCYPNGLEKTLCKWEVYVPLVAKGLTKMHGFEFLS
jgi:hypothetical protein